ncbi:MAG: patatin-like phospholipase family protein [Rickettsiales bacterium]|nr:patatin-like phospholipase family protein [Rickettsiales bacterium]
MTTQQHSPKTVSIALQGGGSHVAFAWGVLDRLLEDERIKIEGISGSSGGAMNGAMVTYGLANGGREAAKKHLKTFWQEVSNALALLPFKPTTVDKMLGNTNIAFSAGVVALDYMTQVFSPHQFNLLDINPFKNILDRMIDWEVLRNSDNVKLFVNATHVNTGKSTVFNHKELTRDMLLASACLPFIFKTVYVDNQPYWDGSYTGNPCLLPLLYDCKCSDLIIIQTHPINHDDTPLKAPDIMDRVTEINFNTNLMHEVRSIALVNRLLKKNVLSDPRYRKINVHMIQAEDILASLGRSSKLNTDWQFLTHLRETGHQVASEWLDTHFNTIGEDSSLDVEKTFL